MNTNEIYSFSYTKLNKEAKKVKKLPLKKEMNLSSADVALQDLLTSCAENGVSQVKISMLLVGKEFGKEFFFEDIEIDPSDPSSLDSVLADDIYQTISSVSSEAAQELETLADNLLEQFQDEKNNPEKYNFNTDKKISRLKDQVLSKVPSSLSKLKLPAVRKTKEIQATEELDGKENVIDAIKATEPEKSYGYLSREAKPIEYDDIPQISKVSNPEEDEAETEPAIEVNPIYNSTKPDSTFIDINEFLNIENSEQMIQSVIDSLENKEKRTKEVFFELLGLADSDGVLEQKKKSLVSEVIDPSFYQKIKHDFESNVLSLKEATSDTLESVFLESDLCEENYEKAIEDFENVLDQEQKEKFSQSVAQLEKSEKEKLEIEKAKLASDQEEELAALKKKHKKDMEILVKERFAEISEIIYEFEKTTNLQYQTEFAEAVNEKGEAIKRNASKSILLTKKEILERMTSAIQDLRMTAESTEANYLKELQQVLKDNEQKLKDEVQKDLENKRKEAELQLIEEQNRLKEREILLNESNFKEKEKKSEHVENSFTELLLAQSNFSKQSIEFQQQQMMNMFEMMKQQTPNPTAVQKVDQPTFIKQWTLSKIAPFVALIALAGGSVAYGVTQHISNRNMQSDLAQTNQVLSESKKALEKFMSSETGSSESEAMNYDSLMREGKYLEAAKEFPSKLNEIEQVIFADKDLETLKKFNRSFSSENGALDENLLSDDVDGVVKSFEKDKDHFKNLSNDRKAAVALCLYQRGKDKEANELLGK